MKLMTLPIFERLIVPISNTRENELAASLIREGCREPIAVWNGVILDGHKRYRICEMEHIEYSIQEVACSTEEEAVIWVCRRRTADLPTGSQAFRYLMGKWYLCEVLINRSVKRPRAPIEGSYYERRGNRTSILMSKEVGIHHSTLEKYGSAATALDVLSQTEPELLEAVMTGSLFLSQRELIDLSRLDEKNQHDEIRKLMRAASRKAKDKYALEERKSMRQVDEASNIPLSIGIKEMPAFNPDMELQGLTLTISTWINVMDRAKRRSNMALVTAGAKENLRTALRKLEDEIETTLEELS